VGLFRRREPLHEKLAREGGLLPPADPRPAWQETGIHGLARPREADATITADADAAEGGRVIFVALPTGELLVEEGDVADPSGLAAAVEQELARPYRAKAGKNEFWLIQVTRIEVLEIPDGPEGDFIEVARTPDGTTLAVDDVRAFGTIPVLEERGDRLGDSWSIRANRLDADLWEIRAEAL
jgi:hypothetical protein